MRAEAYRRYLIRETLTGEMFIEKGGDLIAWASSFENAKEQIDLLLDNYQEQFGQAALNE